MLEGSKYKEYFNKSYYETPNYKSGYSSEDYQFENIINKAIPELIRKVFIEKKSIKIDKAMDIGCAFGWMVQGMVDLDINCFGQDISTYAVNNVHEGVSDRVQESNGFEILFGDDFDFIFSVDTFDRIPPNSIDQFISNISDAMTNEGILFFIIGLGHDNNRGADLDQAKQILQPRDWWVDKFKEFGFVTRQDCEAEIYQTDVWVEGMESGEYLARMHDWNVFVFQKGLSISSQDSMVFYDRSLLPKDTENPSLLIFGSRHGEFHYPDYEFFQIDNWGNYLSYFFNGGQEACYDGETRKLISSSMKGERP